MAGGPITGGRIRSRDGTRLAYLSVGSGPTLVFLHGGLATGADWMPTVELLSDRYRCVVVDRRSCGASDAGVSGHSIGLEVEDLEAVLEMTGGTQAVVGHSFGAIIALHWATRPWFGAVKSLVVYDAPLMVDRETARRHLETARRLTATGQYEELLLDAINTMLEMSPELVAGLRADARVWAGMVATGPTLLAMAEMTLAMAGDTESLRGIGQPTLFILGAKGSRAELFERSGMVLGEVIPQLEHAVLAGQGHTAMLRAPELLAAEIGRFLEVGH